MASTNDVIFPESMEDILANPVDICFGSMLANSTTPPACLVIEGNAVTADQQIGTDLLTETHPPTPSDLIAGIGRVEGMLSDMIKVCERVKRPRRTSSSSSMPLGLRNTAHVASLYMKRKIQIESRPKTPDRGNCRSHIDELCPVHKNPKHMARQCRVLNLKGAGAGVLLISLQGEQLNYVLQIHYKASNNGAEYEALIHGLRIEVSLGIR
jgi:hypothetical protein